MVGLKVRWQWTEKTSESIKTEAVRGGGRVLAGEEDGIENEGFLEWQDTLGQDEGLVKKKQIQGEGREWCSKFPEERKRATSSSDSEEAEIGMHVGKFGGGEQGNLRGPNPIAPLFTMK